MHSQFNVEVRNWETGKSLFTARMNEKADAILWAEQYLAGMDHTNRCARVWEYPQTSRNKGGILNKIVWDSRFPNEVR